MIISKVTTQIPIPVPDEESPAPVPYVPPQVGLTLYLTGADGSLWNLTDGPVQLRPGVGGLLPPNVQHRWKTSPLVAGATRDGYGLGTQAVRLPLFVSASSGLEFRDLDDALWRALDPERECRLTVVAPDAETRARPMWFTGPGDDAGLDFDPVLMRFADYALEFEAEDPHWQGATSVQTFRPSTPAPYYAPPGSAFVKTLMPSQSTGNATIRNPGQVPAWPVYSVSGSVANFTLGVGGATITYGAVADGATVWIDTHPARQTVGYSRGDNNETAWLGVTARDFAAVPPGADVPFTATLTTPGANASVSVELTPRYRRPW